MRKYIDLLENSIDDSDASLDRENAIIRIVTAAASKIGFDLYERHPIYYDEHDDQVNVRIYGEVSLTQLEGLRLLGTGFVVATTSTTDVLEVRFKPISDIDKINIG